MALNEFYEFDEGVPSTIDRAVQEAGRNLGMTWGITTRVNPEHEPLPLEERQRTNPMAMGVASNPNIQTHIVLIDQKAIDRGQTVLDPISVLNLATGKLDELDLILGMYPLNYYEENSMENNLVKEAIIQNYVRHYQHATSIWALDAVSQAYPQHLAAILEIQEQNIFRSLKDAETNGQLQEYGRKVIAAGISHRCANIAAIRRYSLEPEGLLYKGRALDDLIEKYRRKLKLPLMNTEMLVQMYENLPLLPKNRYEAVRIMEATTITNANLFLKNKVRIGSRPYVIRFTDVDGQIFHAWNFVESNASWN
jgi:hypothetical protein